ncbi:hypothetical protein DFJ63DRAFT_312646 [Scheffersomyces coipomensis]|uniref:uncharacterized protein n=1 Tax=Scheffersomyces coipomensis TaxID=1788519 RepID=UPI00315C6908
MDARRSKNGRSSPTHSNSPTSKHFNLHPQSQSNQQNQQSQNQYQHTHHGLTREQLRERRHSSDSTINYNLYLTKRGETSKSQMGSEFSNASTDPYDDIDELNFDLDSVINPIGPSSHPKKSKSREITLKYFTLAIILLPSMIAIIVPSNTANENHKTEDLANLIIDCFMIILVSWTIKFTIEWPWNWLKQLKDTRYKLINHINSKLINQKSQQQDHLIDPDIQLLNDEILCNRIELLKKILNYEKLSIFLALIFSFLGSGLMMWSRNNILIEDSRKKIVFNNLNIGLFQFWQFFRIIISITENLQHDSTVGNVMNPNPNINEYELLNEHNLNLFLPKQHQSQLSMVSYFRDSFEQLFQLIHISMNSNKQDSQKLQQEFMSTLLSKERDLNDSKFENLQLNSNLQMQLIEKLLNVQNDEFSNINSNITKLESIITDLKKIRKSSNSPPSRKKSNVYVKPFPLNLSMDEDELVTSTLKPNKMHTIFEENSSRPNSNSNSPRVPYIDHGNNRKVAPPPELPDRAGFSLHGLASSIEVLPGKSKEDIIRDVGYDEAKLAPPMPIISMNDPNFSILDNDNENKDKNLKKFHHRTTSTIRSTFQLLQSIKREISIFEIIKNPFIIRHIVQTKIIPLVREDITQKVQRISEDLQWFKTLIWQLSNTYVFMNVNLMIETMLKVDRFYLQPLRNVKNFLILIFTKIPLNILEIYFEIMIFIPKIWIKLFILNPINMVHDYVIGSKYEDGEEEDIGEEVHNHHQPMLNKPHTIRMINKEDGSKFEGMKKLHLKKNHKLDQKINNQRKQIRTRDILLQKLVDNYDLQSQDKFDPYEFPEPTPVAVYNE